MKKNNKKTVASTNPKVTSFAISNLNALPSRSMLTTGNITTAAAATATAPTILFLSAHDGSKSVMEIIMNAIHSTMYDSISIRLSIVLSTESKTISRWHRTKAKRGIVRNNREFNLLFKYFDITKKITKERIAIVRISVVRYILNRLSSINISPFTMLRT
ncbi:MAG: hypothetical protein WC974_02950 [Thermoplasmata archaeon]